MPTAYGPPQGTPPGYGQTPPGYGQVQGTPPEYGQVPPGYGPAQGTPLGYGQVPPGYGQAQGTPPGYGQVPPGYGQVQGTPPGYGQVPPGYGQAQGTPPGYGQVPPGYGQVQGTPPGYGQAPPGWGPSTSPSQGGLTANMDWRSIGIGAAVVLICGIIGFHTLLPGIVRNAVYYGGSMMPWHFFSACVLTAGGAVTARYSTQASLRDAAIAACIGSFACLFYISGAGLRIDFSQFLTSAVMAAGFGALGAYLQSNYLARRGQ